MDNLVDALGGFAPADGDDAPEGLRTAFERTAALQVETIAGARFEPTAALGT